jgi:hypothetical protein
MGKGLHMRNARAIWVICAICAFVVLGCKAPPAGRDASNLKATAVETNLERKSEIRNSKFETEMKVGRIGNVFTGGAGVIMITQVVFIVGLFGFLTATARRMLAYREGLRVVQGAVKEAKAADVIELVKPRVRAMGKWRKKMFDGVLSEA